MRRREFCCGLAGVTLAAPASHDLQGQVARRLQVCELHRKSVAPLFDQEGRWLAKSPAPARRERLWNAMSLLAAEETRALGNAVLRRFLEMPRLRDHFVHSATAQILFKDRGELEADVKTALTDLLFSSLKEDGAKPIRFMGYNDNFPAMDAAYAVIGGRALDYAPARQRGREALERARELLLRRGLLSEYTSATYSPVSLLCFAEVAESAEAVEERALAAAIENRIWLDIASHWHQPTNILAGAHSRAYMVDSVGHYHQAQMVLYHVYGEKLWMTPQHYMFPPAARQEIHHDGDVPFMQVSNVWMASGTYHPRPEIARLLFEKPSLYRVVATSEFGAARVPALRRGPEPKEQPQRTGEVFEYPSGELVATTYLTEDYGVGSSTAQFHNGYQTDAFFVNFRRAAPARSIEETSTIFCRYTSDQGGPGVPWVNPENPQSGSALYLFADEGRVRTVQKDNVVLVAYQAKGQIHGTYRSLRLTIVIPTFYRPLKRILVGETLVDRLPFVSAEPGIVWIDDGLLFAAFRPMMQTNHGRPHAIRIAEQNRYLTISLYNYEGPAREFTRLQLHETLNGFVAEVGSRSEGSFDAFWRRVLAGKLTDEIGAGGQRVADYRRDGVQLGLSYSLLYDGVKYILVDGQPQRRPVFEATLIDPGLLAL